MNTEQLAEEIIIAAMIKCIEEHANASHVIDWMKDPKRKPAITAFTEGPERQIAYEFERVLDSDLDKAHAEWVRNQMVTDVQLVSKVKAKAYDDAAKIVLKSHTCLKDCKCLLFAENIRQKAKEVGRV